MKPWIKQYRLIGRENRDQKKEIESLHSEIESLKRQDFVKMRHNLAAANARAEKTFAAALAASEDGQIRLQDSSQNIRSTQMDFRNDSEMLPPPLIPIASHNEPTTSSAIIVGHQKENELQSQPNAQKVGTKSRTKSKSQTTMSYVLQKSRPWRCTLCSGYFSTIEYLRQHVYGYHPNRKYFCGRCPHSSDSKGKIDEHEQDRDLYHVCYIQYVMLTVASSFFSVIVALK